MQDIDIHQRFQLLQKEIEATVSLLKEAKLDLSAAVDSLRIDIEVMKMFIERHHPGFFESYPRLREEIIQAVDPEWIGSGSTNK